MAAVQGGAGLRRTWPQRLLISFNIFLIVVCLVTAGGLGYLYYKIGQLPRITLGHVLTDEESTGEPQNFLLVGTDSSEGIDPQDPITIGRDEVAGLRSDTIMILRVDPESERAALLSLPRDLWVPIAGERSNQRINTAIETGGPERLVETVEGYLDVPIHHYVQVDFLGFQELVGAVGGVPVYFPSAVRDRASGLVVEQPGCITLDGDQALAYSRSRSYEVFEDGSWQTDPSGDLGRISRQQDFIRRALKRSVSQGVRNPVTLNHLIDVGIENVTVDDGLTARDMFSLGRRFRSFNPENLDMYTLPVVDVTVGGAAVLQMLEEEAQAVLQVFRGVDTASLSPSAVRVQVLNGSGVSGQAGEVAEALGAAGFGGGGTGDASSFGGNGTTVRHASGEEAAGQLVARYLEAGADVEEDDGLSPGSVVLVTGTDFAGVLADPRPAGPDAAPPPTGPADPAPLDAETTTTVGQVPGPPPPDVACG